MLELSPLTAQPKTFPSSRQRSGVGLGTSLGLAGLVLWMVTVLQANFLRMGPYGLVSVLGWTYFVGLFLVVVGFAAELLRTPLKSNRLIFLIIVLVVFLYGTGPAIEPVATLSDSWLIAGFVQYVVQHGHLLNSFDARFSWPGGLTLSAVLVAFAGQANAYGFLRWFPLVIELAYLAPLLVIARVSGVSKRAGWLGVALYYATNWIFQDYFSPQALNFLFFLVVIAAVLACWQPIRANIQPPLRHVWRERIAQIRSIATLSRFEGHDATSEWSSGAILSVLALVVLICLASSMSHQLTPFAILLALGACLITRRLGRPELVVAVVLLSTGWLSLGASNFWAGHLNLIFGSAGQLGSTVASNVTSRVTGSSSHLIIVELRILVTAALLFLGGVGFLRRFTDSRLLEVLAAAPFLLVLAQTYGGEAFLRVVFYALPFIALLAASAILPSHHGSIRGLVPRRRIGRFGRTALRVAVVIVVLGFSIATTVARGGNDAYDSFSRGELAAVTYAYAHAHRGETIGSVDYFLPIEYQRINTVGILSVDDGGSTVHHDESLLLKARPSFIILSTSQEAWGELVAGYPRGWEAAVEQVLVTHGYNITAYWTTATVLTRSALPAKVRKTSSVT